MKSYNSDTNVKDVPFTLEPLLRTSLNCWGPTFTWSWTCSHSSFSAGMEHQFPSLTSEFLDITHLEMLESVSEKGDRAGDQMLCFIFQ